MSDWIKWHGETNIPPTEPTAVVNVIFRTGKMTQGEAKSFSWKHVSADAVHDIVNYQIVVKPREEPLDIPVPSIDGMLADRGKRYGKFTEHANITQDLKCRMRSTPQWLNMSDDQKECLEMIAHKIGRILNGDPHYYDSWKDIAGYARLVSDRLELGVEA